MTARDPYRTFVISHQFDDFRNIRRMQIGRKTLSAFYIVGAVLTLFAIISAPSIFATIVLILCLLTLYALNGVGGVFSLRVGQLCGGVFVISGVIDLLMSIYYASKGYATGIVDLLITVLIIWIGWLTIKHLSTRSEVAKVDVTS